MERKPQSPQDWTRKHSLLAATSLCLCVSPTLTLLLEWAVAALTLGHPPAPSLDDPKSISRLASALHLVTTLAFLSAWLTPIALPLLWFLKGPRSPTTKWIALGCLILPFSFVYLIKTDPYEVIGWWLD